MSRRENTILADAWTSPSTSASVRSSSSCSSSSSPSSSSSATPGSEASRPRPRSESEGTYGRARLACITRDPTDACMTVAFTRVVTLYRRARKTEDTPEARGSQQNQGCLEFFDTFRTSPFDRMQKLILLRFACLMPQTHCTSVRKERQPYSDTDRPSTDRPTGML